MRKVLRERENLKMNQPYISIKPLSNILIAVVNIFKIMLRKKYEININDFVTVT